jgi:hypothetical protein
MKRQGAVFWVALFAACQAFAQQTTNAPSTTATVTVQKPKLHWLAPAETKKSNENLKPVAGLAPRAWTTVVGWHPGESAFATGERHEGRLCLLWVDLGPSPVIRKVRSNDQR